MLLLQFIMLFRNLIFYGGYGEVTERGRNLMLWLRSQIKVIRG